MTFVMIPGVGYYISDVKVNGSSIGAVPVYTFTDVTAAASIHVVFEKGDVYTTYFDEDKDGRYDEETETIVSLIMSTNARSAVKLRSVCPCDIDVSAGKPSNMLMGLAGFEIELDDSDIPTAEVIIRSSEAAATGANWYFFDESEGTWSQFSAAEFSEDRTEITLTLTDGGDGDADGKVNGWIVVDPSGFGIIADDDGDDNDDNCFVSSANNAGSGFGVNPLMLMLMALIAGSAVFFRQESTQIIIPETFRGFLKPRRSFKP